MEDQTNQIEQKSNKGMVAKISIVILFIAGIFGVSKYLMKSENIDYEKQTETQTNSETVTPSPTPTTPTLTPSAGATQSQYKDGVYTATGSYRSPGGAETIGVSLTLKNDIVVDSTVTPNATLPNSVKFQEIFTANYKTFVTGKNINDIKLTKVSGSSLTPNGFNDAVAKIKIEAQS